jgi:hypothetical protein
MAESGRIQREHTERLRQEVHHGQGSAADSSYRTFTYGLRRLMAPRGRHRWLTASSRPTQRMCSRVGAGSKPWSSRCWMAIATSIRWGNGWKSGHDGTAAAGAHAGLAALAWHGRFQSSRSSAGARLSGLACARVADNAPLRPSLAQKGQAFLNRYKMCATGSRSPGRVKHSMP